MQWVPPLQRLRGKLTSPHPLGYSHMKGTGMLFISLRGVSLEFGITNIFRWQSAFFKNAHKEIIIKKKPYYYASDIDLSGGKYFLNMSSQPSAISFAEVTIARRYLFNWSPTQPFLVSSRNAAPHKRLLPFELHAFPFVFVVIRNNQSCLSKLTMT